MADFPILAIILIKSLYSFSSPRAFIRSIEELIIWRISGEFLIWGGAYLSINLFAKILNLLFNMTISSSVKLSKISINLLIFVFISSLLNDPPFQNRR